ncbi:ribosome-recycling factor [Candidatus Azambacteria bacterium]|nr:ribosome-recycling factor [Candidatus Azambacteria bacterium]
MDEIIRKIKSQLDNQINRFTSDIQSLRSSRVNSQSIEDIMVVLENTQRLSIKQLASLSVLPPNTILISPWDKNSIDFICKAISNSALGGNPSIEGTVIKLVIQPLTEEKRLELVKFLKNKAEMARIAMRKERDEALKALKGIEKTISKDLVFQSKKKIQEVVDLTNSKIDALVMKKEGEIMKV